MSTELRATVTTPTAARETERPFGHKLATSVANSADQESAVNPAAELAAEPASVDAAKADEASMGTVTELASHVQRIFRDIELNVDPDNGEVVVKVLDRETGDVVRQIPAEEMLRLARFMRDLKDEQANGLPGGGSGHEGFLLHTRA
jgi:flagellar protein FlaG